MRSYVGIEWIGNNSQPAAVCLELTADGVTLDTGSRVVVLSFHPSESFNEEPKLVSCSSKQAEQLITTGNQAC